MPFIIKAWIPADPENPDQYPTREDAQRDIDSLELMQPENRYEIVEV